MPAFTKILTEQGPDKFAEILSASGRKAREVYFRRHEIKPPKAKPGFVKPGAKNEARVSGLFSTLQGVDDDEMAEEALRTWLLGKRALLSRALDHLGIAHNEGLTESEDLKRFADLSVKDVKALVEVLGDVAPKEDIKLYLQFMGAENVSKVL